LEGAAGKIGVAEILGIRPKTLLKRMSKPGIPYGKKSWQPSSRSEYEGNMGVVSLVIFAPGQVRFVRG